MSEPLTRDAEDLDALRREIDSIDERMHALLMQRAGVIEELIAAKRLGGTTGSAFRPGREAAMLRRLAARHEGALPLPTVEHVWREIIGAFTQLQAPFKVHAAGANEPAMRDMLRFHFGFSAPFIDQPSPAAVIEAVGAGADLGVVPLDGPAASPWWDSLSERPGGIKVIAALPFLGGGAPRALVVGPAAIDNPDASMSVFRILAEGDPRAAPGLLASAGPSALIAAPDAGSLGVALDCAGLKAARIEPAGSYSTPDGA